jgi:hypothetical protein
VERHTEQLEAGAGVAWQYETVHFTVMNGEGKAAIRGGFVQLSGEGLVDVASRGRL